jgi:hypothetical protein
MYMSVANSVANEWPGLIQIMFLYSIAEIISTCLPTFSIDEKTTVGEGKKGLFFKKRRPIKNYF